MRRPLAVSIIAGFLFAATFIAGLTGASLLFPSPFTDRLFSLNPSARAGFEAFGRISGTMLVALGASTLAGGVGLWHGRRWAWRYAVVLFAVNGTGDLIVLLFVHDWLRNGAGVLIPAAFLCALSRVVVRDFCQR